MTTANKILEALISAKLEAAIDSHTESIANYLEGIEMAIKITVNIIKTETITPEDIDHLREVEEEKARREGINQHHKSEWEGGIL